MNVSEFIEMVMGWNLLVVVPLTILSWFLMGFLSPLIYDWVQVYTMEKNARPRAFLAIQENMRVYVLYSILGFFTMITVIVMIVVSTIKFFLYWSPNEQPKD